MCQSFIHICNLCRQTLPNRVSWFIHVFLMQFTAGVLGVGVGGGAYIPCQKYSRMVRGQLLRHPAVNLL